MKSLCILFLSALLFSIPSLATEWQVSPNETAYWSCMQQLFNTCKQSLESGLEIEQQPWCDEANRHGACKGRIVGATQGSNCKQVVFLYSRNYLQKEQMVGCLASNNSKYSVNGEEYIAVEINNQTIDVALADVVSIDGVALASTDERFEITSSCSPLLRARGQCPEQPPGEPQSPAQEQQQQQRE